MELELDVADLDPAKIQQVKWLIRERGLAAINSPISLLSISSAQTDCLRSRLTSVGPNAENEALVPYGTVRVTFLPSARRLITC